MIELFKAFTTQEDFFYDGAFIAKVIYRRFKTQVDSEETYKNEIIKNNRRLCIIDCNGYINEEIVERLTVYLMMNVTAKETVAEEIAKTSGILWRNFSKKEIADFSNLTGDTNSIHLTDNPVVQGLFILKELCETTKASGIEVRYVHPVYGENPVYIEKEENSMKGFSNNVLCFEAKLI